MPIFAWDLVIFLQDFGIFKVVYIYIATENHTSIIKIKIRHGTVTLNLKYSSVHARVCLN